ncbi:MAG: leucine-rich repeat domain-containing protein [Clostridiales bacterium]|nr:leucine-rich repeat domain-containing protein [Clostridiales bacterium]
MFKYLSPKTVTSIGNYAFAYSTLSSVTVPENVSSLGDKAFSYCASLEEVIYCTKNISSLGSTSSVFYNAGSDSSGISVYFTSSVESVPAYLFMYRVQPTAPILHLWRLRTA